MLMTLQTLKEMQEQFDRTHRGTEAFYKEISDNDVQTLEHLIVCLVGEVGEFANIVKKIKRGDFKLADKKIELDEELTDIFIYVLKISNQLHVDLESKFLEKLASNKVRFQGYEV
jgi:NTP pyrophosphatase (non-canonical NTP hydrolase)